MKILAKKQQRLVFQSILTPPLNSPTPKTYMRHITSVYLADVAASSRPLERSNNNLATTLDDEMCGVLWMRNGLEKNGEIWRNYDMNGLFLCY